MTTTADITQRIIDILVDVQGVKADYFSNRVVNIPPFFAVRSGASSQEWTADDMKEKIISFDIIGYIAPIEGGIATYSEKASIGWIDAINDLFDKRPHLQKSDNLSASKLNGVMDSYITGYSGLIPITTASATYLGYIWTLQVTLRNRIPRKQ